MKALLIVDVQNDFCPGGSLAVAGGDEIIPVINRLIPHFEYLFMSKDWHPEKTVHFEKWPVHCVQNSFGAQYRDTLQQPPEYAVELLKGTGNIDDGYSVFEATNYSFKDLLLEKGIDTLYVVGLATDYCVKASVLDALRYGFNVFVVLDAVSAVDLVAGDGDRALQEMKDCGATMIQSNKILI